MNQRDREFELALALNEALTKVNLTSAALLHERRVTGRLGGVIHRQRIVIARLKAALLAADPPPIGAVSVKTKLVVEPRTVGAVAAHKGSNARMPSPAEADVRAVVGAGEDKVPQEH